MYIGKIQTQINSGKTQIEHGKSNLILKLRNLN